MANYISDFSGQHNDDYDSRINALLNTITEQQNTIITLTNRITTLENKVNSYDSQLLSKFAESDYIDDTVNSTYKVSTYISKLVGEGKRCGYFQVYANSTRQTPESSANEWWDILWFKQMIGGKVHLLAMSYSNNVRLYRGSCWYNNTTDAPIWTKVI